MGTPRRYLAAMMGVVVLAASGCSAARGPARGLPASRPGGVSGSASGAAAGPSGTRGLSVVGYVGCSNTEMAVQGYHHVGGGVIWPALGAYGGGSIDLWVSPSSRYLAVFAQAVRRYPPEAIWWHLCMHPGTTLAQAQAVLGNLRGAVGAGVPVYASPMAPYAVAGECRMADPAGSLSIYHALLKAKAVLAGPTLTPLSPGNTEADGCHPLPATRELDGEALRAFFG